MPIQATAPKDGGVYDFAAMAACGVDYFTPMACE